MSVSTRNKRGKAAQKDNYVPLFVLILMIVIGIGVAIKLIAYRGGYVSHTDEFVFSRDVAKDGGLRLSSATITATDGHTLLSDLCSQELQSRWGSDGEGDGGVGLKATFNVTSGNRGISSKTFDIPAWRVKEETDNDVRRNLVRQKCIELESARNAFTAPVARTCIRTLLVDTTSGMNDAYDRRIEEILGGVRSTFNGGTCPQGGFYLHHLTASASQGDRWNVQQGPQFALELNAAHAWLSKFKGEEQNSSVLGGIYASLAELQKQKADLVEADIFTDGLENSGDLSVYRDPSLLEPANWSKLNAALRPALLNLNGVTVHLHSLPGENARDAALQAKAFIYLTDRLTAQGAKVDAD